MSRARAERSYTDHSKRGKRYEEFFCLRSIGIRVGYASATLLRTLPVGQRAALSERVVWISTSNPHYALRGIHPGAAVATAARRLHLGAPLRVGRNDRYLASAGSSTAVLKARHGIVQEVGIADTRLIVGRRPRRAFFDAFS